MLKGSKTLVDVFTYTCRPYKRQNSFSKIDNFGQSVTESNTVTKLIVSLPGLMSCFYFVL